MKTQHSFRWWFYIIVPIISAVLTVVGIEMGFTIFFPVPFSIESNMYFEPDPFTGYRLKPNSIGYYQNLISATTNKHGHRDKTVSIKKPEGGIQIAFIG